MVFATCVLAGAAIAAAPPARAATTPPTFGPQFDLGSGFGQPAGVAVNSAGDVYVADTTANTVWEVPAGGGPTTPVGSGYRLPMAVAVDSQNNVYVADWGNGRVERVASNGTQTTVVSGLSAPSAVAVGADGKVYIANTGAGTVLKMDGSGSGQSTVAAGINYPTGLAVAPDGTVYVADSSNAGNSVYSVAVDGAKSVLPIPGLQNPNGLALDAGGDLFVANAGANNVLMVTPDGTTSHVGSYYIYPEGVAVNSAGDVIVADTYTPRVTVNPSVDPQSITLTHELLPGVAPGTSGLLGATGGASGSPITFSVSPDTYPSGTCTISPTQQRVRYKTVGTCVIDIDQAGSLRYLPAHRAVTVIVRPPGLAALAVHVSTTRPSAYDNFAVTSRGKDASGNDLGDVTAITTFSVADGNCYQDACYVSYAGPATIKAAALRARGKTSISASLAVFLESGGNQVTSFPATVGTAVDGAVYVGGGSSDTYTFHRTGGSFPPGVTLGADGSFSGSPSAAGSYPFTIIVTDASDAKQRVKIVSSFVVDP